MNKSALREFYLSKRRLIDENVFEELNNKIKHQFLTYFEDFELKAIHTFLPIENRKEINTLSILHELRLKVTQLQVVVSKSNLQTLEMTSYLLKNDTALKVNRWGIPEPIEADLFDDLTIDMVLIPLVIFDESGHRVGYGKGFYDRFLKKCRRETIKVGLCLEPPVRKISDTHSYDVTLDYCVSPEKVFAFKD